MMVPTMPPPVRPVMMGRAVALLAASLAVGMAGAQEADRRPDFVEGVHYVRLPVPVQTRDPARIEVVEVFNYNCIVCYRMEPLLETWLGTQEEDVDFHRVPLVSMRSPALVTFAQAYFTAEVLDLLPKLHMAMFEAIHDHGLDMSRPEYVRRLFLREGEVSEERFQSVFDSFGVRSRVRQADGQGRMYRVVATPTLIVNGRYVPEPQRGGEAATLLVVNHLIAKEREARAAPQ